MPANRREGPISGTKLKLHMPQILSKTFWGSPRPQLLGCDQPYATPLPGMHPGAFTGGEGGQRRGSQFWKVSCKVPGEGKGKEGEW